jgi:hypothetical protein
MNLNPFCTLTVFVKLIIISLSNHLEIKAITGVVTITETPIEAEILKEYKKGLMECKQDTH